MIESFGNLDGLVPVKTYVMLIKRISVLSIFSPKMNINLDCIYL